MHRGTIRVDSKEGEGSTFTVTIPLTYVANPAAMVGMPGKKNDKKKEVKLRAPKDKNRKKLRGKSS